MEEERRRGRKFEFKIYSHTHVHSPELIMDSTVLYVAVSSISSLKPYVGMIRLSKSTISSNPLRKENREDKNNLDVHVYKEIRGEGEVHTLIVI